MAFLAFFVLLVVIIFFLILRFAPEERQSELLEIFIGFVEVIGVNLILTFVLLILFSAIASRFNLQMTVYVATVGIVQLVYAVWRSLFLRRQRQWFKLKGVIIGSVLVALLNGGCWIMFSQMTGV
jgi:hypothetical protein